MSKPRTKSPPTNLSSPGASIKRDEVQVLSYGTNGLELHFLASEAYITIPHIKENGKGLIAELNISLPPGKPIMSAIEINLKSSRDRINLARNLAQTYQDRYIPWDEVLEFTITEAINRYRQPPELENISADPDRLKLEYLIEPLLVKDQPTTIFSPGGKGKSIFADYLAILASHGEAAQNNLPFIACKSNVLYLDWESDLDTHRRYISAIEASLGLGHETINYLSCDQSFNRIVGHISQYIKDCEIDLVIVDSQMAATSEYSPGMSEAQIASAYYNDLRSLKVTTLTIDHVTKQSMIGGDNIATPYGSVVKYNRSRSQYELRQTQDIEADYIELALVHKKFNLGKLSKPLGMRIEFFTNENEELTSIVFKSCDLADNPELSKLLSLKQQAIMLLKDAGVMKIDDMAEELDVGKSSLESTMYRDKNIFVRVSKGEWGLLEQAQF